MQKDQDTLTIEANSVYSQNNHEIKCKCYVAQINDIRNDWPNDMTELRLMFSEDRKYGAVVQESNHGDTNFISTQPIEVLERLLEMYLGGLLDQQDYGQDEMGEYV